MNVLNVLNETRMKRGTIDETRQNTVLVLNAT